MVGECYGYLDRGACQWYNQQYIRNEATVFLLIIRANYIKMKRNGFTLIEVLIAVVVGLVIMAAVYSAMIIVQRTSANLGRKVVTQQDTRAVLDFMAMEIRMASYNPTRNSLGNTWSTIPNNCASLASPPIGFAAPVVANKGIQIANGNGLLVAMDLSGDGAIGCSCGSCCGPPNTCSTTLPGNGGIGTCAGLNEYIAYSYDGVNTINRNVSCGGNSAILGGAAPGSNISNAAAGFNLFRYFDGNDNELVAPVNIPAIRRILITIVADTAQNDLNTGQPRRMIYSTNVIVRNHAPSP